MIPHGVWKDIHVNSLLEESLPTAITIDSVQAATKEDKDLSLLFKCLQTRDIESCKINLPKYHGVFGELSEIN